jgi:perosamine synthetase
MRNIPFGKPIIGDEERRAVAEVLNGNILVHGPRAVEFETRFKEFTGAPFAVSVASCTAAMHLFYFYAGIGPGDEVIVPAQTHTATAHAVELCGAKPVFIDSEKSTGNIDIDQIEPNISEKTRAISVVHYLGMPVQMDRIIEIAKRRSLLVLEDCALAIGTRYNGIHAGCWGDVGCFSFYPVKHITTAEGGMLITGNRDIAEKISKQKAFGLDRTVHERSLPGIYDVTMLGFNYRMSEIQAALGIEQMKRIKSFLEKREENYQELTKELIDIAEITLLASSNGECQSSYYCHSVILDDDLIPVKSEIVNYLKEGGVGTSVYYPKPVPHFTYYKEKYGYGDDVFPVAAWISRNSVALPVGPHLDPEDMRYIAETLKYSIKKVKRS